MNRRAMLTNTFATSLGLGFGLTVAARAQDHDGEAPTLTVSGELETPLKLTAADLAAMPRVTVQATDHGGVRARFEGVALHEILARAGAPLGRNLRGPAATSHLIVTAADGYRVVFALAELDPAVTTSGHVVLLADRRNGQPMTAPEGPLRIVVPGEKEHGRWARMVTSLNVRRAGP
jgi:DMSO/TMAO reductase YedYZ molybdopterin-dependent catalytic subunit